MTPSPEPTTTPEDAARQRWGAVVIGAGPAGGVAAYQLASSGLRTLLIDRTTPPRGKVCGCCLAPWGAMELEAAGLGGVLSGARSIGGVRVRTERRDVRIDKQGYRVIARDTLDARIAAAATEAGAQTIWGESARVTGDGTVRVGASEIVASAVLVADGLAGSSLNDHPGFEWNVAPASLMGAGVTVDSSSALRGLLSRGDADEILMLPGRSGYLGLAALPCGRIDLAAALRPDAVRSAGGPGNLAAHLLRVACADESVLASVRGAAWKGTPTLTRRRSRVQTGPVLVIGDAAGYVEPFTGEGMSWALAGARCAALLVARHDASVPEGAWSSAHARLLGRHHRRCGLVAGLLRRPMLLPATLGLAATVPGVSRLLGARIGSPPPSELRVGSLNLRAGH